MDNKLSFLPGLWRFNESTCVKCLEQFLANNYQDASNYYCYFSPPKSVGVKWQISYASTILFQYQLILLDAKCHITVSTYKDILPWRVLEYFLVLVETLLPYGTFKFDWLKSPSLEWFSTKYKVSKLCLGHIYWITILLIFRVSCKLNLNGLNRKHLKQETFCKDIH